MKQRSAMPDLEQVWDRLSGSIDEWIAFLVSRGDELGGLLGADNAQQKELGYGHTLREISQQPLTWMETARAATVVLPILRALTTELREGGASSRVLLTGSGSSLHAGECLVPGLQGSLQASVTAIPAGEILTTLAGRSLPAPSLVVSFARSGNSPESCGVVETLPGSRHLVVTCNPQGRLATSYAGHPWVSKWVLDEKTCDRSLVMTSSFTNMVVAGLLLGMTDDLDDYQARVGALAVAGARILTRNLPDLARLARTEFRTAVYLGSGGHYGAARESALKMLEMTAGRVKTFAETYLGLRHGPMCAVDDGTLVVCFLSTDPTARAYELDLVRELDHKKLGAGKVFVGHDLPKGFLSARDVAVELTGLQEYGDAPLPVLDVLVGQILAFFRCLSEGLRPDQPSADGVISRVVVPFALHRRP